MNTPTPTPTTQTAAVAQLEPRVPQVPVSGPGKATNLSPADYNQPHRPGAAQALADAQRRVAAASNPAHSRMVAILHNAAMDLWDVATETDAAQMWEEARAIASRILAACPAA